jgi:hypothetical protein
MVGSLGCLKASGWCGVWAFLTFFWGVFDLSWSVLGFSWSALVAYGHFILFVFDSAFAVAFGRFFVSRI